MERIDPARLAENFIELIGREWMLVTAGSPEKFNTMTASWGGAGFLWNRPVAFVFVRPERYTYEFMERESCFTLSFLGHGDREAYRICGSKSGRRIDKAAEAGTLECRKLYASMINEGLFVDESIYPQWYGETHGGDHKMYIAEILNCWVR